MKRIIAVAMLMTLAHAGFADDAAGAAVAEARQLPPVGTAWCYTSDGHSAGSVTLASVTDGVVTYRMGTGPNAHEIRERVDDYTLINPNRKGTARLLHFPLKTGVQWHDAYDATVTARVGAAGLWQYDYREDATSRVVGTEKLSVAAGTFDTFVVERFIAWTKSNPRALGDGLKGLMQCDSAACAVSGYSKEVLWYAPTVGRAVPRAYVQSGDPNLDRWDSREILKQGASLVTELTAFGPAATCQAAKTHFAYRNPDAPLYGFALHPNNTWEFLMIKSLVID